MPDYAACAQDAIALRADPTDRLLWSSATHMPKPSQPPMGHLAMPSISLQLIYDLLMPRHSPMLWTSIVWSSTSTPKHSFIHWFYDIDPTCTFCTAHPEIVTHLSFFCPFTISIWIMVRNWSGILREMSTLKMALKWLKKENGRNPWIAKLHRHTLASIVYFIWCARNRALFESENFQLNAIVRKVQIYVFSIIIAWYSHVEEIFCQDGVTTLLAIVGLALLYFTLIHEIHLCCFTRVYPKYM